MSADFKSHTYPYERVYPGYNTYSGSEKIPDKLIQYLLDMPDARGYTPEDDNARPRVRLMKYLWHDTMLPLDGALPTPKEKRSLLFDPTNPVIDTDELKGKHPKGYRIFGQAFWEQQQDAAQTTVKIYMGRTVPRSPYQAELGIFFEIFTASTYETNTKSEAYARTYAMEQAIIESLLGVNVLGVGSFNFDRCHHSDNGSRPMKDEGKHVGRLLHMSVTWMDGGSSDA